MYIAKQETKSVDQSKGKYIYLCLLAYTFLILSLPDGIKNMTCLYKMTTKGIHVTYTYNYYLSFLEIPIIFLGLLYYKYSRVLKFIWIYILIFAINIAYFLIGASNIITLQSYESFLLLLTGFCAACIVLQNQNDYLEVEKILDWFIVLQFALQIVSMVSGASGADGRYAAIGMGSGATASLACEYLIWTLFARKGDTKLFPVICAVVTILLSGSRTNLLVFLLIAIIFLGKLIKKQVEDGHSRRIFWVLIIGVPALILAIFFGVRNGGSVERFTSLFEGNFINNVTTDDSFLGRQRSIEGSFRILKDHPMGIPFSIYAIENLSSRYFTMEYPHSTLLSYILLWGPIIAIFVFVYIIRLFVRAIKLKDNSAIYLGYYIFILIFYGSPILYAKSYAFIFVILSYIKSKLDDLEQERNMELTNEENYLIR